MLFLVEPSLIYKDSFLEQVREFQAEGRVLFLDMKSMSQNFEAYLQKSKDASDPAKVAPGRVPDSEYWLIDGAECVGRLSLRHKLNEDLLTWGGHIGYMIRPSKRMRGYGKEILRLGLIKARALGLKRVLLTCDEDNVASRKIIEHNGGKLENVIEVKDSPVRKMRFWIDLA